MGYNGCFSEYPIQIGYSEKQPFRPKSETVESEGFCKRSNIFYMKKEKNNKKYRGLIVLGGIVVLVVIFIMFFNTQETEKAEKAEIMVAPEKRLEILRAETPLKENTAKEIERLDAFKELYEESR